MSAYEVKDKLVAAINENKYDFIVVNFANGDMVGHTGIYEAIEKAVVAVDACVKDVIEAAKAQGYEAIIIADHGNADHALNEDGTPNTAHSLNPVPCVYVTENKAAKVEDGRLADVAPPFLSHISFMIQIEDVVVSFDVLREKFLCNLDACKGECCIEGDAGAPVELDEVEKLEEVLPIIWEELSPEARAVIEKQGVVYTDQEGDLVTSIVNNKDCVFTCYDEKGCCYCAIEKAYRDGKTDFYKPVSCHLYPIRIGDYGPYKAVNYHRWDVCKAAVLLGKKENVAVYQFLKEPLIRKFGEKWYQELEVAVKELKAHDMI